ncbi:signaling mucin MSB2-like [Hyalella azteca]|uniref:Signaling mucin MSB2-like n=1 Tax=Hyalella azteca TaxID=294128 RepID=A0A8B7PIU1_HYAAZ|nr:signaling mucin MSB2-like [Hyalella azteca]
MTGVIATAVLMISLKTASPSLQDVRSALQEPRILLPQERSLSPHDIAVLPDQSTQQAATQPQWNSHPRSATRIVPKYTKMEKSSYRGDNSRFLRWFYAPNLSREDLDPDSVGTGHVDETVQKLRERFKGANKERQSSTHEDLKTEIHQAHTENPNAFIASNLDLNKNKSQSRYVINRQKNFAFLDYVGAGPKSLNTPIDVSNKKTKLRIITAEDIRKLIERRNEITASSNSPTEEKHKLTSTSAVKSENFSNTNGGPQLRQNVKYSHISDREELEDGQLDGKSASSVILSSNDITQLRKKHYRLQTKHRNSLPTHKEAHNQIRPIKITEHDFDYNRSWPATSISSFYSKPKFGWKFHVKENANARSDLETRATQSPAPPTPVRAPRHDHVCIDPRVKFGCASCSLSVICIDSKAFVQACAFPQESCYPDPAFGGGVCKPGLQTNCSCIPGVTEEKPDPFDPRSYLQCDGSNLPKLNACETRNEFLITEKICAKIPPVPRCSVLGTFANVNDCRWYYSCLFPIGASGSTSYRQVLSRCATEGTMYSNTNMTCQAADQFPANDACLQNIITTTITTTTTMTSTSVTCEASTMSTTGTTNTTPVPTSSTATSTGASSSTISVSSSTATTSMTMTSGITTETSTSSFSTPTTSTTSEPPTTATSSSPSPTTAIIPIVPTPAPTTTSTPATVTTTTAVTAPPIYTCPFFVIFFIFWWPGVVDYLCWIT